MKDSLFWDVTVPRIMSSYAIGIFIIFWIGLLIALITNQSWLDILWQWVGSLPLWLRIIVWLIFLPVMVGLWVWQSTWVVWVKLLAFGGLVAWTGLAISSFIKNIQK